MTVVPTPTSLVIESVPFCWATRSRALVSPRPVPPSCSANLPRANFSKIVSMSSGWMPRPWSAMVTVVSPGAERPKVTSTGVPDGEYFRALATRLVITRCIATPLAAASATSSSILTRPGSSTGARSLDRAAGDLGQVDVGQQDRCLADALGGEADESLDHGQQAVRAGLHPAHEHLPVLLVRVPQGVDEPLQCGHRGPEVVVEGGVERVLRVLDRLEVGAVPGDLGVAGQVAGLVVERRDHDVTPEPRPVLAHPPAGVLDPTGLAGLGEQLDAAGRRDGRPRCRTSRSSGRSPRQPCSP